MPKSPKHAIAPARHENYPEWYQEVVKAAELAETSPVRGCMIIKPWGYGIWERVQAELDDRIKATGHENAYFPLFVPVSFLEKEATHVEGFAKECAVVTHHRLEAKDGKLVPAAELEEPLVVRPTSETIIGDAFSRWVQSYRDLPLLINQWANVVRWEMRTRVFLRTAEFLWQEGHTAHASADEAHAETRKMLDVYRELAEECLAMPVIVGEKPESERFPGAEATYAIEAMMQDRKALQAGTSHYLGQNFARAFGIQFLNQQGVQELAYTTSWGVSTRLIGGVIMTHADDDGLRLPPRIAPKHAVVLPVITGDDVRDEVLSYADEVLTEVNKARYLEREVVAHIDARDLRGGEKNWQWIKKGIPLRIEAGPRDIAQKKVVLYRRDQDTRQKQIVDLSRLAEAIEQILPDMQRQYFEQAKVFQQQHLCTEIKSFSDFREFFTPENQNAPEIHGGFVRAKWCGTHESEKPLTDLKVTIRTIPFDQSGTQGKCVLTGEPATVDAVFAKAY